MGGRRAFQRRIVKMALLLAFPILENRSNALGVLAHVEYRDYANFVSLVFVVNGKGEPLEGMR